MALKPGIYLDIGVGANDFNPAPYMLVDPTPVLPPRQFVNGARYLGIDMPLRQDRSWRAIQGWFLGDIEIDARSVESSSNIAHRLAVAQGIVRSLRPGESIDFAVADGIHLPLPDSIAAEVYMGDVVGSQLIDSAVGGLLSEAARVLKPGAELIIRETNTPGHAPDLGALLPAGKFADPEVIRYGTPEYEAMSQEYGRTAHELEIGWPLSRAFFLRAVRNDK